MTLRPALLAILLAASPALAEVQPLSGDSRVETFLYESGKSYVLRASLDGMVTVIFAPGEVVEQVVLGDPASFDASVAPQGDSLILRTLRPVRQTRLAVRSNLRNYDFDVQVGPPNDVAYAVRFGFMAPPAPQPPPMPMALAMPMPAIQNPAAASGSSYKFKGNKTLRPKAVREDGSRTYIEWSPDQALPAVFALNSIGEEETVDGYMRGDLFTIDRVHDRLVFRLGKAMASAERFIPKKRSGK